MLMRRVDNTATHFRQLRKEGYEQVVRPLLEMDAYINVRTKYNDNTH
jgi:hypothetical protein